jgi:hypothetical protein
MYRAVRGDRRRETVVEIQVRGILFDVVVGEGLDYETILLTQLIEDG